MRLLLVALTLLGLEAVIVLGFGDPHAPRERPVAKDRARPVAKDRERPAAKKKVKKVVGKEHVDPWLIDHYAFAADGKQFIACPPVTLTAK